MKITIFFLALAVLSGCSKNTTPEPEFYLSATVDGKSWVANEANSQNTPVAAIISKSLVVVAGGQNTNSTVTALGLVFPETIDLNKPIPISPAKNTALAYAISQTEGYSADPAKGGSGTMTITRLDKTAGIIEGTFSGEAVFTTGTSRSSITNGRFRTALYTTTVTTPAPGKR